MCLHVHMNVCVCVCARVHTYVCMFTCMLLCVCVCVCVCAHAHNYVCVQTDMFYSLQQQMADLLGVDADQIGLYLNDQRLASSDTPLSTQLHLADIIGSCPSSLLLSCSLDKFFSFFFPVPPNLLAATWVA